MTTTLHWSFASGYGEDSSSPLVTNSWIVGGCTRSLSADHAHDGTQSMLLTWDGSSPDWYSLCDLTTPFGGIASVSMWVWVPTGTDPVVLSATGGQVFSTTNDAWEELTLSLPAGFLSSLALSQPAGGGSCYVDDVTITYPGPVTTTLNWGFETSFGEDASSVLVLDGWSAADGDTYGCTTARSTTRAHAGTHSMLVSWDETTPDPTTYATISPNGFGQFTVSAWVWVPSGSSPAVLSVGDGYKWGSAPYAVSSAFNAWQKLSVTVGSADISPNPPYGYLYIEPQVPVGDPGVGTVYVDQVQVAMAVLPPAISPSRQTITGQVDSAISSSAAYTGIAGATYSISPSPADGLSFDSATGILSGTPTVRASQRYTVTATNGFASATADIYLAVGVPPGIYNDAAGPAINVQLWRRDLGPGEREWQSLDSSDIRSVSFRRGRNRPDFGYDAGVMTVTLDNASGNYDPDWTGSDWYPLLAAGTKFRLLATWDEVDYTLFTGFLESNQLDHGFAPTSTLTIADAISRISCIPTTAIADALYDTEYDDEPVYSSSGMTGRLLRLLDAGLSIFLGNDDTAEQLDVPDDLLRKMTPIRKGATFTQILDECALVEGGIWYITKENVLGMYRADNKFDRPTRLYLSDSRDENTLEYDVLQVSPGAALLCNDARLSVPGRNSNDEQYWWQYSSSVSAFGIKSIQLSAPVYNTDWAQTLAKYYCRRYAEPTSYASHVEISAQALDVLYPDLLSCELADLLTVERTTVDGRTLTWNCVIEGIQHQITPNSWRVAFDTSPVNGFYPSL